MFAKDEALPFADQVFILSCQHDMASAAASIFDRNNDAIFFVAEQAFINAKHFGIGFADELIALVFKDAPFFIDSSDAFVDFGFEDFAAFGC